MGEVFASGPSLQQKFYCNGLREEKKNIPENLFAMAEVLLQPVLL